MIDPQIVLRDYTLLNKKVKSKMIAGLQAALQDGHPIAIFETFRYPERQSHLFEIGRSQPGRKVTNADAWESWHNYGLAFDVACKINNRWSWDYDFTLFSKYFIDQGLHWLGEKDKPHYQANVPLTINELKRLHDCNGIFGVWEYVDDLKW